MSTATITAEATSMKAIVNVRQFRKAFGLASKIVPAKDKSPILRNVLLWAPLGTYGQLRAVGKNNLWVILAEPSLETHEAGMALLPVERVRSILATCQDETLAIKAEGPNLTISGADTEWRLETSKPEDYPEQPDYGTGLVGHIPANELRRLIARTKFATDRDDSTGRWSLGGCLMEFGPKDAAMVATDGRRLARQVVSFADGRPKTKRRRKAETPDGIPVTIPERPIVPATLLDFLGGLLPDDSTPIGIGFGPGTNQVHFNSPHWIVCGKLIEGRFPKYQEVYAASYSAEVGVNVGRFRSAVRRTATVVSQESKGVEFTFNGRVIMEARSNEIGSARTECPVEGDGVEGEISISLDPRFLLGALNILSGDSTARFRLNDHKSVMEVVSDDGFRYALMPLVRERDRD